ncbi:hypothetical protein EVAR_101416_1 [Eumeta japonica]|uniref:Uncharacterized protein n=1 Tax=Eumeta variegata TaxID=151549 RepID=A0A4C1SWD0_EUMVA|nr:hypothetical protein EVAR_101416_1 [Eumeta japonica]
MKHKFMETEICSTNLISNLFKYRLEQSLFDSAPPTPARGGESRSPPRTVCAVRQKSDNRRDRRLRFATAPQGGGAGGPGAV